MKDKDFQEAMDQQARRAAKKARHRRREIENGICRVTFKVPKAKVEEVKRVVNVIIHRAE